MFELVETSLLTRLRNRLFRVSIPIVIIGACALYVSLPQQPQATQNSRSDVVKLSDDLRRLARGELSEVKGEVPSRESFILIYGYPNHELDSLPISEALQKELEAITPGPTETYILAHVDGDGVREFTRWELSGRESNHPVLEPAPFMIRGESFRITAQQRNPYRVLISLD